MRLIQLLSLFRVRLARLKQSHHSFVRRQALNPISVAECFEVRCLFTGGLDPSFGFGGRVTTTFGTTSAEATSMVIQTDGKIVAVGKAFNGSNDDFALARYNVDGSLDTSFDGDGKLTTDFGSHDFATSVTLQTDGKIVVAGTTGLSNGDFALARYNADGSLDMSFGVGGKLTTDFGGLEDFVPGDSAPNDFASSVALQADGKIIVAGATYSTFLGGRGAFALARYNSDGSLDASFDGDGKETMEFSSGVNGASAQSLVLQTDGRIVLVGYVFSLGLAPASSEVDPKSWTVGDAF